MFDGGAKGMGEEAVYAAELGAWMRTKRRERSLNQDDIAAAVGVTRNVVSRWELGRCMPSPYRLHLFKSFMREGRA
jgi:DNA-binding transcriptional regulator YiaG